jgi:hypothetical protein
LVVNRSLRLDFEWRFGQRQAKGEKLGKKIKNDDKSE